MAKKATTKTKSKSAGKLAGKTVAFVGKFGYSDHMRRHYQGMVYAADGTVVDAANKAPDYLWVGEGRGGKLPGDVAKIQKQHAAVTVMETNDFAALLMPNREEFLVQLQAAMKMGERAKDAFWEAFHMLARTARQRVDLTKVDLRKAQLDFAKLENVNLENADLRAARARFAELVELTGIDFRQADLQHAYLAKLADCNFRDADLSDSWFFYHGGKTVDQCDFTSAKLPKSKLEGGVFTGCKFTGADLSDVESETSTFDQCDFSNANLSRLRGNGSVFKKCNLSHANLTRANLTNASLAGANLRNANLREAVLIDADLRNADLTGADLQNAALGGAKLDGVDLSKAKNYAPPVQRKAGPRLKELNAAAAGSKSFTTTAEVDLGKDEFAKLTVEVRGARIYARSRSQVAGSDTYDYINASNLQQAVLGLRDRWPSGTLRLDSIAAKGSTTVRGKALQQLAVAAWAEAFDMQGVSAEQLAAERTKQQTSAAQERQELLKKIRKEGAKSWNKLESRVRDRLDLTGADLSNAKLNKLDMWGREDLVGANFSGSSLVGAEFWGAKLHNANFTGANLKKVEMSRVQLQGANLTRADLTDAELLSAKLQGANFTGAKLSGAALNGAQFDHKTVFPAGFRPPEKMIWKGEGTRPAAKKPSPAKAAGSLGFADFIKALNKKVEKARMEKASSMLKKEKFQLFAEVDGEALGGIVKSQTDKDLVYSCRLTSKGDFGCCTQNLNACGGLRGALCKHLLVLIIGLAKAGQLDSATVDNWINLSRSQKPKIDDDAMSATFLKYKGAEAGEIDWRPTETIPEDFYSM